MNGRGPPRSGGRDRAFRPVVSDADTPKVPHKNAAKGNDPNASYIDADSSITFITATVTRSYENQVWTGAASSNTISITASSGSGEYYLKLTLSDGQSYQGKYIIE